MILKWYCQYDRKWIFKTTTPWGILDERFRFSIHMISVKLVLSVMVSSLVLTQIPQGLGQPVSKVSAPTASSAPDGRHDFDFEIGTWNTHLKRLLHPLTGSSKWVEYDGTTVVRSVWDGRANLVELVADGPTGHFEGLNLRLYNPQSHQWSLNFANSSSGTVSQPTIGEFKDGRGEFYDQEPLNGRMIFVRFVISEITPNACRFEQAFSNDGGKTWEVNWIATDTRTNDAADKGLALKSSNASREFQQAAERDGQHDFDWAVGFWNIHLKKLVRPLTGSTEWVEFDGTVVCKKVWDGRAELEEFNVNSPEKNIQIQGLALRLYDPASHQWSIYWSNASKGTLDLPPMVGQFSGERGEFYNQDVFEGRSVFTRFVWSGFTGNTPHFEQSYSVDGGKTWEVNWKTDQTKEKS